MPRPAPTVCTIIVQLPPRDLADALSEFIAAGHRRLGAMILHRDFCARFRKWLIGQKQYEHYSSVSIARAAAECGLVYGIGHSNRRYIDNFSFVAGEPEVQLASRRGRLYRIDGSRLNLPASKRQK